MPNQPLSRDELARRLVALREASHMTISAAAGAIGRSQSTLSRWEAGRFAVPADGVSDLADLYRVDAQTRERLLSGARGTVPAGPRVFLHRPDDAATRQRVFGERERRSVRITTLGMTVVPGLLQTEPYMRAVVTAGGKLAGDRLEEWVVQRLWRQRILTESGRQFLQIVSPGALLWCAHGPETMLQQIEHLTVAARLPSVRLGVVPIGAPVDVFPLHNADMYEDRDGIRSVVVGTLTGSAVLDADDDVGRYADMLERVERRAVFGDEAKDELHRVAELYR